MILERWERNKISPIFSQLNVLRHVSRFMQTGRTELEPRGLLEPRRQNWELGRAIQLDFRGQRQESQELHS